MQTRIEHEDRDYGVVELDMNDGYHVGMVVTVWVADDGAPRARDGLLLHECPTHGWVGPLSRPAIEADMERYGHVAGWRT